MVSWQILTVIVSGLGVAWLVGIAPPIFVIGATAAVLLGLVFIQRPDAGLMLLLVARASSDATLGSFMSALAPDRRILSALLSPNTALILILIIAGGLFLLGRGLPFISLPAGRLYALLLLTGLIGLLRSDNLLFSLSEWLPGVSALIVYALVANLFRDPRRIQRVIDVIAVSFILPAVAGFHQLVSGEGRLEVSATTLSTLTRIDGTFVHPNAFAFYLVIVFSIFLCQAIVQSGRRRWIAFCIIASSLVLLMATYTRAAWVGIVAVLIVVGALRRRSLLLLTPFIVASTYRLLPPFSARLENPLGGSFASRVSLWGELLDRWADVTSQSHASIAIVLDRLGGLGPGSFASLISAYPHNDYLRVLLEFGVFGLVLFIGVYVALVRTAFSVWRQANGSMAAVALSFLAVSIAYLVMSVTDNLFAFTVNQVYFWALAGLVAAIGGIRNGEGTSPGTYHTADEYHGRVLEGVAADYSGGQQSSS